MDFQKKNRFMLWTIVVLLILNISTLALLWFGLLKRPKPLPPPGTHERLLEGIRFLEKELNLSEKQIQQFIESRNKHAEQAKGIHDKIHHLKKQILDELFKSAPDSVIFQKLSHAIGNHQSELEQLLIEHFLELKSYCRPEQQEKLKGLFFDLALMSRPPKPHVIQPERGD